MYVYMHACAKESWMSESSLHGIRTRLCMDVSALHIHTCYGTVIHIQSNSTLYSKMNPVCMTLCIYIYIYIYIIFDTRSRYECICTFSHTHTQMQINAILIPTPPLQCKLTKSHTHIYIHIYTHIGPRQARATAAHVQAAVQAIWRPLSLSATLPRTPVTQQAIRPTNRRPTSW